MKKLKIASKYRRILIERSAPLKVFYSGRAAGKSHNFARAILFLGSRAPLRIVCARQFQSKISQSVKTLLDVIIRKFELDSFYTSYDQKIEGINGTIITFTGLDRNLQEFKGLEDVDICWVEEAQSLKQEAIDILLPTIRKKGSEIWISMNPILATDPAYNTFVTNPMPGSIVVKTSFLDNPYVEKKSLAAAAWCKKTRPKDYLNIWLGEPLKLSECSIFSNYKVNEITPSDLTFCNGPYYGMDFGHTTDPCTVVEVYIDEDHRKLYITREAYAHNLQLDDLPTFIDQLNIFDSETIIADSSRPETISFLCRRGGGIIAAKKYPGSVLQGIEFIKNFQVIIAPQCEHTLFEFINYEWEKDSRTGLPKRKDPKDDNNHIIDAVRYALNAFVLNPSDEIIDFGTNQTSRSDW